MEVKWQGPRLSSLCKPCPITELLLLYVWVKTITSKLSKRGRDWVCTVLLLSIWLSMPGKPVSLQPEQANMWTPLMARHLRVMLRSYLTEQRWAEKTEMRVKYIQRERETPQKKRALFKDLSFECPNKQGKSDLRLPSRVVNGHTTFRKSCLKEMKSSESYCTLLKPFNVSYENVSRAYLPKTRVLWSLFTK